MFLRSNSFFVSDPFSPFRLLIPHPVRRFRQLRPLLVDLALTVEVVAVGRLLNGEIMPFARLIIVMVFS